MQREVVATNLASPASKKILDAVLMALKNLPLPYMETNRPVRRPTI